MHIHIYKYINIYVFTRVSLSLSLCVRVSHFFFLNFPLSFYLLPFLFLFLSSLSLLAAPPLPMITFIHDLKVSRENEGPSPPKKKKKEREGWKRNAVKKVKHPWLQPLTAACIHIYTRKYVRKTASSPHMRLEHSARIYIILLYIYFFSFVQFLPTLVAFPFAPSNNILYSSFHLNVPSLLFFAVFTPTSISQLVSSARQLRWL